MEKTRPSNKATYADLFERLLDPTFLTHPETFEILDANMVCERELETPVEQLVGKRVIDFIDESKTDEFNKYMRVAKRRYYPRTFDTLWKRADGTNRIMEISACALKLQDESEVIQVIATDVTHERETEQKLERYLKELETANQKLEQMSITDEMTKIANFRHFKEQLKKEHERAKRFENPYCIIFCDVDNFKHFNDRNGHPAGDEVLRGVARILKESSRDTDLVARYGGEEFVVLCPQVNTEQALVLAERLRKNIESHPFAHREHQPLKVVSISMGVACFPENGVSPDEVLKAADEGVYHSKKNGRNQITTANFLKKKK